ncbi:uncharacterized protein LOC126747827 [Anthonomus grandis grandis]|uniref:uncharacterized protein LOC126747827 n=1 Tax=Anthonomus grandis grandis TaxID=2921223 RepID=UPI00216614D3|nr:uncharacterized protein LOC126747827 [Anthonomus grandis grandis]
MEKHSKKRQRENSSSSSEDEYTLRKKYRRIHKRLEDLERREKSNKSKTYAVRSPASRRRSRSPDLISRADDVSISLIPECESQDDQDKSCFDNDWNDKASSIGSLLMQSRDNQENNNNQNNTSELLDSDLNATVLSILGYDLAPKRNISPPFQKEVALSWEDMLKKGLLEDERVSLMNKYTPPENCPLLEAPKVNQEVLKVMRDVIARRDKKISELQNQVGSAISALGQALTNLLKDIEKEDNRVVIQLVNDAARLLLDFHQKQSKVQTRTNLFRFEEGSERDITKCPSGRMAFRRRL